MNKIIGTLLATSLLIGLIGNAQAGPDSRDWREHRPSYGHQYNQHHHYTPPRVERRHRPDWVAPAAMIALGGLAIGTAIHYSNASPAQPNYNYSAPPAPPAGQWYFCRSSGQYYPYTNACPEGWQAVPPH